MKVEVRHPQGGVSGSRGHWSMEVSEGWFTGEPGAQARFMDGDVEVLADSLVLGDSLGLAFGEVAICDTLSRYRLHADSARFSAPDSEGEEDNHIALMGQASAWIQDGMRPLRCGASARHPTRCCRAAIGGQSRRRAPIRGGDGSGVRFVLGRETGTCGPRWRPGLWNGPDQLSGDSVRLFLEGQPERLEVRGHAFVSSPASGGLRNQLAGRDLDGLFEGGRLTTLDMVGNGRTLYFADPDSQKVAQAALDSLPAPLPQANRAACTEIRMRLDSAGLASIVLLRRQRANLLTSLH